ncbi:MAG: hypothetical protein IPN17_09660 [Deltaproteobacteria bacterium]|jgi:hypothetical protein|nr:hypothetical protein [Deltaproteobacteria bacterium]MBK8692542.1 hypothetical protein [Deltaproteobacteria bacterium]MBP6832556.1 hypothetical protein [Deltaproteobacteria bacterium]
MLVRRGDLAGADAEYRRAIEMLAIDPVRQHTFRSEWLLNCHADRRDEALREVDVALAVDPTYGIAIGLRRRVLAAMRPRSRWWRR